MLKRPFVGALSMMLCVAAFSAIAAEPTTPMGDWVPQDAILALEVSRPKAVLDMASNPKTIAAVTALPAYEKVTNQPKWREFQGGVAFLEARFGIKWPEALHKLLDGGVSISVHPHEGVLLIAEAQDERLLNDLHEMFVGIARGEATKVNQPDRVKSKEYGGVTIWTFAPTEAHAIVGNRLVLTNRPALLKESLDLRGKKDAGLRSLAAYQAAGKGVGSEAVARAFVNLKIVKQVPDVQKILGKEENPLAALLFAAVLDAVRGADWLGLALDVQKNTLVLHASVDGKATEASAATAFALPHTPGAGALPNLVVPRSVASLSLYRDLHGFYAAKDQLFPDRTSGLIFFENMMGIFFTGRDLTDEVLAETRPEVRVVVAGQKYDPEVGTPQVQFPAFAAIFRTQHPEKVAEMTEEAWQKALGLVNFTRGQKAEQGLIIDRETYHDVRLTVSYFSKSGVKDKANVDMRFNFRPTLARVGDSVILSSTDGLAKDLIDALKNETAKPEATARQTHSILEVDIAQVGSAFQANREVMVRNSMVEKGKARAQAESEFDLMVTVLQYLGQAKLDVGAADSRHEARLELKLNLP